MAVVEVASPSEAALSVFHARCTHGVPLPAMRSMLAAWQPDQKAALLRPHGVTTLPPPPFNGSIGAEAPPSHDVAAPPAHPDAPSVLRWLSARHCVHYSHARSKTHLLMQVGGEAAAFVHVPPQLRASFHEAYVADGRPKYLCELRDQRFRFYADVRRCFTTTPPRLEARPRSPRPSPRPPTAVEAA